MAFFRPEWKTKIASALLALALAAPAAWAGPCSPAFGRLLDRYAAERPPAPLGSEAIFAHGEPPKLAFLPDVPIRLKNGKEVRYGFEDAAFRRSSGQIETGINVYEDFDPGLVWENLAEGIAPTQFGLVTDFLEKKGEKVFLHRKGIVDENNGAGAAYYFNQRKNKKSNTFSMNNREYTARTIDGRRYFVPEEKVELTPEALKKYLTDETGYQTVKLSLRDKDVQISGGKRYMSYTAWPDQFPRLTDLPAPSAEDFRRSFPHDLNDLRQGQTRVRIEKENFLVSGYDPVNKTVRLESSLVKTFREGGLKFSVVTGRSDKLAVGNLVKWDGNIYEVRAIDTPKGSGMVAMWRPQVKIVPWEQFEYIAKAGQVVSTAATASLKKGQSPFSALFSSLSPKRAVELVGKKRMRRLEGNSPLSNFRNAYSNHGFERLYEIDMPEGKRRVSVAIPQNPERLPHGTSYEKMADEFVAALPWEQADANSHIYFELDALSKEGTGIAEAEWPEQKDGRTIRRSNFFRRANELAYRERIDTLWHETGHQVANKIWNNSNPSEEWARATVLDGKFVTEYATTQKNGPLIEDFAETFVEYIRSDAGRRNPASRALFPNRFLVLDKIFQLDGVSATTEGIFRTQAKKLGIRVTTITAAGGGLAYVISDESK